MQIVADQPHTPTAIRTDLGAIFVSLELSRSIWLITGAVQSLWSRKLGSTILDPPGAPGGDRRDGV